MSATTLLSWSLGILALAAAAELTARLAPRRPALAHALWLLALVRSLVPPVPLVAGPRLAEPLAGLPFLEPREASAAGASSIELLGFGPRELLFLAWGLGTVWCFCRAVQRSSSLRRLARLGAPVSPELRSEAVRAARALGVRTPKLLSLPSIRSPFLFGVRTPILFWPEAASEALQAARRAVLLHELAHVKRRDPWSSWIEVAAACAWWWNPVVLYAVGQTRRYKELACDAWVLERAPSARRAYAGALLDAAEASSAPVLTAESLGWVGSGSRLPERLRSLYAEPGPARVSRLAAAGLVVLFAASLPGLSRSPATVSTEAGADETRAPELAAAAARAAANQLTLERLGVHSFAELQQQAEDDLLRNAANGRAYSLLGWALLAQGHAGDAVYAFERQYELGYTPSYASYNAACGYSLLGDVEQALSWLRKSVESGYDAPLEIERDEDLALLRSDPRFRELIAVLRAQAAP